MGRAQLILPRPVTITFKRKVTMTVHSTPPTGERQPGLAERSEALFHGGVAGMKPGDVVLPDHAGLRLVDDCPVCQAHANGDHHALDPATPSGWVYATSDRAYARYYASRAGRGTLYRVTMLAPELSTEDVHFPSWRAPQAVVTSVLEILITLTDKERRRLYVRWGGTRNEYDQMVRQLMVKAWSA